MQATKKQQRFTVSIFCLLISLMFTQFCYAEIDFIENSETENRPEIIADSSEKSDNNALNAWQKDENSALLSIRSLYIYNSYLYALTATGEILRAKNSKGKWLEIMDGLKNKQISSLCLHTKNLYALTTEGQLYKLQSHMPDKDYWGEIGGELKGPQIISSSFYKNHLYAGTMNGVYVLDTHELTWTIQKDCGLKDLQIEILYSCGESLYASTTKGVYEIEIKDNTSNWISVGAGLEGKHINSLYKHNEKLYVGTEQHGIYRLDLNNQSSSWEQVLPQQTIISFYSKDGVLYAGTAEGEIPATQNDGNSWTKVTQIGERPVFYVDDNDVYAGTLGGLYKIIKISPGVDGTNKTILESGPVNTTLPEKNSTILGSKTKIDTIIATGAGGIGIPLIAYKVNKLLVQAKVKKDKINALIKLIDDTIIKNQAMTDSVNKANAALMKAQGKPCPEADIQAIQIIIEQIKRLKDDNEVMTDTLRATKKEITIKNVDNATVVIERDKNLIVDNIGQASKLAEQAENIASICQPKPPKDPKNTQLIMADEPLVKPKPEKSTQSNFIPAKSDGDIKSTTYHSPIQLEGLINCTLQLIRDGELEISAAYNKMQAAVKMAQEKPCSELEQRAIENKLKEMNRLNIENKENVKILETIQIDDEEAIKKVEAIKQSFIHNVKEIQKLAEEARIDAEKCGQPKLLNGVLEATFGDTGEAIRNLGSFFKGGLSLAKSFFEK